MSKTPQQRAIEEARRKREEAKAAEAAKEKEVVTEELDAAPKVKEDDLAESGTLEVAVGEGVTPTEFETLTDEEDPSVAPETPETGVKEDLHETPEAGVKEEAPETPEAGVKEDTSAESQTLEVKEEPAPSVAPTQPTPVTAPVVEEAKSQIPASGTFVVSAEVEALMCEDLCFKLAIKPWLVFGAETSGSKIPTSAEYVAMHKGLLGAHTQLVSNINGRDKVELALKTIRGIMRHYNRTFGERSAFSNQYAFRYSGLTDRKTSSILSAYLFLNNQVTSITARSNFNYETYFAGVNSTLISEFYRRLG